jgi:hypothetical protein
VEGTVLIKQSSIDALIDGDSDDPPQSNRGRPPDWPRDVWMECLLVLSLRGEVNITDSQESIAETLASELENVTGKKPSVETVKRDWLRPVFKKVK